MKRYSLYTILLTLFISLIFISSISIYFFITSHRKDLIETAIEEKTHLAEIINETIASPLWIHQIALIPGMAGTFIEKMAKFEDVKYLKVVSSDGIIYQSSIEGEWGEKVREQDISKAINTKQKVVKDQIFEGENIKLIIYPGYKGQTVWVGFTLEGIESAIQEVWFRDILIMVEIILIFLLILVLVLRNVVNPLRKMTLTCEEVRKGNLDVRTEIKSRTEMGQLSETFDKTIQELKKSQESLKTERASMEIKVKTRTKELGELAASLEGKVKERTKELQDRVNELEEFHRVTVGRELRIIELKKEMEKLKKELKKKK